MKKLFLFISMVSFSLFYTQEYPMPLVLEGNPTDLAYGISKNMTYEVIYQTDIKQKDLIEAIKLELVEFGFIEKKNEAQLSKINNNQSKFEIPMYYFSGVFAGRGKTSLVRRLKNPVAINYVGEFSFNEKGQLKIKLSNFKELGFFRVNDYGHFHTTPSMTTMLRPVTEYTEEDKRHEKLIEMQDKAMKSGTLLGKFNTVMESGSTDLQIKLDASGINFKVNEGLLKSLESNKNNIDEEMKVLQKGMDDKVVIPCFTDTKEFLNLYPNDGEKVIEFKKIAEKRAGENYLLLVDNDRWNRYFRKNFNDFFVYIGAKLNAKILGIAQDGVVIYNVDDKYNLKEVKK